MASSCSSTLEQLTEDYHCGYCLQRLPYMVDPRALPCQHVFCLPCLQADITKSSKLLEDGAIDCTICGQTHSVKSVASLPKAKMNQPHESKPCDVCECSGRLPSVSYCVDCGKKLCKHHLEIHDQSLSFLSLHHSTININSYNGDLLSLKQEMCSTHEKEKLVQACKYCYKTFCLHCKTEELCEGGEKSSHTVMLLKKFAENLKTKIRKSMKAVSDKISEICKIEKTAWNSLDAIDVEVKKIIQELEEVTNQQILEIKFKFEELKEEMEIYLRQSTKLTEEYTTDLMGSKEDLQNLWKSTNQLMRQTGDAEIVRRMKESSEELEKAKKAKINTLKIPVIQLSSARPNRNLEVRITSRPSPDTMELQKVVDLNNKDFPCSVCWNADGTLVVGGLKEIKLYDKDMSLLKTVHTSSCSSIVSHNSTYVAMSWRPPVSDVITLYSNDLQVVKLIDAYPSKTYQHLAVNRSSSHIIAMDHAKSQLKFYQQDGHLLDTVPLGEITNPTGIHVLADGSILLSDPKEHAVVKVKIKDQELTKVWSCEEVNNPRGISTDYPGYIYVASSYGKILVLSNSGNIVRKLTHPELEGIHIIDVSVSGDMIAVTCSDDNLRIFRLIR